MMRSFISHTFTAVVLLAASSAAAAPPSIVTQGNGAAPAFPPIHHDENCLYGRTPEALAASIERTAEAAAKPATEQVEAYSPALSH